MKITKSYIVKFRLVISYHGSPNIGIRVNANNIVEAISLAEDELGKFAFKEKHPIDGYEIYSVFRNKPTEANCFYDYPATYIIVKK